MWLIPGAVRQIIGELRLRFRARFDFVCSILLSIGMRVLLRVVRGAGFSMARLEVVVVNVGSIDQRFLEKISGAVYARLIRKGLFRGYFLR